MYNTIMDWTGKYIRQTLLADRHGFVVATPYTAVLFAGVAKYCSG